MSAGPSLRNSCCRSRPEPRPDRRLAGESFRAFSADVFALVRRPPILIALALFLAPCGTFSLTNLFGGLGDDFHASPRTTRQLYLAML